MNKNEEIRNGIRPPEIDVPHTKCIVITEGGSCLEKWLYYLLIILILILGSMVPAYLILFLCGAVK